jgi:uncharacterized protein (TIGR00162 family)
VETFIKERLKVLLRSPILIEGFPGLGYVGKIAVTYMAMQLNAKRLAELYSPYFPHHVLTTRRGGIRLPRAQFHYYKSPDGITDIVFCTSDTQAQSIEGQYDVVEKILGYAKSLGVETVIAVGGFSGRVEGRRRVVCAANSRKLLERIVAAGAEQSPLGNPIVGLAGVTLGMASFIGLDAACILGETIGHLPDPEAAKCVLSVIQRFLSLNLDIQPLDKEIEKATEAFRQMEAIQREVESITKDALSREVGKVTYIS